MPSDMKNSPLTSVLLGVLTLSALASVAWCWLYIHTALNVRSLNMQAELISQRRMAFNALLADTAEYSKKDPAMEKLLDSFGIKVKPTAPASTTNKPASK